MLTLNNLYIENSKYGHRLNINHPLIRGLYTRYKRWKNIPYNVPLSDNERFEFEDYIEKHLKHKGVDYSDIPTSHTIPD